MFSASFYLSMCAGSRQNSIRAAHQELAPQFANRDKASYASEDAETSSAASTCSGGSSTRSNTKEPPTETKQPATMKEKVQAEQGKTSALKHAAEDEAIAAKDKAKAIKEKVSSAAADTPQEDDANSAQKETMQMSQAFVQWLVDGGGKRTKKSDTSRQTVLKTVVKFSGVQVTIDDEAAVMGKKKVHLVGSDEQRQKAKDMMQSLASRGQVAEGSLMGMLDAWGEMGGIDDPMSRSNKMIMPAGLGYECGNAGYESYSEPPLFRQVEPMCLSLQLASTRRNMMKKEKADREKALVVEEAKQSA